MEDEDEIVPLVRLVEDQWLAGEGEKSGWWARAQSTTIRTSLRSSTEPSDFVHVPARTYQRLQTISSSIF